MHDDLIIHVYTTPSLRGPLGKEFLPPSILESFSFATSRRLQGPIFSEMLLKELKWQAHGENKKNTAAFL